MYLNQDQRSVIERVINTIETGRPDGDYGALVIYADGPHSIRQITYGRAQTTEYGNLRKLVQMYAAAGGLYSSQLAAYAPDVGSKALTDDIHFRSLLRDAGRKDPVMRDIQDRFFEQTYFISAVRWANDNGFVKALSALVIYDSFIHSGSILWLLRNKFLENPPASGGREKVWIAEYVRVRHNWLAQHTRPIVRKSKFRTEGLLAQIKAENWDLSILPIRMNGIDVYPAR